MSTIDNVYPNGVPVDKAAIRADDKTSKRRTMVSVQSVRDEDLSGQFGGIYVNERQASYDLQTGSTDPDDDGATTIVDYTGNRFRIVAVSGQAISASVHAATSKSTPVDADELPLVDSEASNVLKRLTWANLKATLAVWLVSAGWIRERLTASRTYYVRSDGSDSNNGLANTSGGAFLTLQKAINTVAGLDINGQSCSIQVAAGTYTASANASVPFVGGVPVLTGDTTNPSNVVLNVAGFCIAAQNGAELSVRGFRLLSTGDGILAQNSGRLNVIGNMEYAACSGAHMHAKYAGLITVTANYSVTGGATWHWWSETAGGSIQVIGRTITITGTPAFAGAWAGCTIVAQIVPVSNTYSGSATGARYLVQLNGVIYSNGATLPGNSAGTSLTGGLYV